MSLDSVRFGRLGSDEIAVGARTAGGFKPERKQRYGVLRGYTQSSPALVSPLSVKALKAEGGKLELRAPGEKGEKHHTALREAE